MCKKYEERGAYSTMKRYLLVMTWMLHSQTYDSCYLHSTYTRSSQSITAWMRRGSEDQTWLKLYWQLTVAGRWIVTFMWGFNHWETDHDPWDPGDSLWTHNGWMMNGVTNKSKKGIKFSRLEQQQNLYDTTKGVLRGKIIHMGLNPSIYSLGKCLNQYFLVSIILYNT